MKHPDKNAVLEMEAQIEKIKIDAIRIERDGQLMKVTFLQGEKEIFCEHFDCLGGDTLTITGLEVTVPFKLGV